jgi:beta-lactamase superfamily II metal-dependent hydrolase
LLTGDADLHRKKNFSNFIKNRKQYFDSIITVQVPHHGSRKNWNTCLLKEIPSSYYYLFSAGLLNLYNHPCENVLKEICRYNKIPLISNELTQITIFQDLLF